MIDRNSREFFRYFARAYPGRTVLMVGLLVGSGLAEGVGIAGLLPVLEYGIAGDGREPSALAQAVGAALERIGLEPTLGVLLAIIVIAMSLKGAFRWLALRQAGFVTARVAMDLRLRLIHALMTAEWSYFTSQPTGFFANSLSSEAHRAAMGYREACAALAGLMQVAVYGTFVFLISWKVALLAVAVGGLILFVLKGFVESARAAGMQQTALMKSLVARLTEALPSIKPVKAMGRESFVLPMLEQETEGYNDAQRRQVTAVESLQSFQEPILVAALAVGLYFVLTYTSTPFSSVLVLAFLFYRLVGGLNVVQNRYQTMTVGESAFHSMRQLIDEADAAREVRPGRNAAPGLAEAIRFVGVDFAYVEAPVLEGVDLELPAGGFVTLLGPSGSGKTTIADLTIGLLTPTAGRITVDGVPLDEIDPKGWRRGIGYVPQDLILFHDSIRRNVTLGNEDLDDARVEEALRDAGAWDFVAALPDGLDTPVGERGAKLSGGQRQRIAIARALVERPRLLILDEATTALDPRTEAEICRTLTALKGRVTVLAISHQSALRDAADAVYEVRDGAVRRWTVEEKAGVPS